MKYRLYVIMACSFFCVPSEAMDLSSPTQAVNLPVPEYDLVALTTLALLKAKKDYESSDEAAKNSPAHLKRLIDAALYETIDKRGISSEVLPTIYSMLAQFKNDSPVYDVTTIRVGRLIGAVDIDGDGMRALVGSGNRAYLLAKHQSSWGEDCYIDHNSPITAVCLASNNRMVSTAQNGSVFVWSHDGRRMTRETSFLLPTAGDEDSVPDYADMIALNDAGDQLVCRRLSGRGGPLHLYKRILALWYEEADTIPINGEMQPTAVGWTARNTIIAYGKPLGESNNGKRTLTEWERIAARWYMRTNVTFDVNDEHTVLASGGYKLTRRDPKHAVSETREAKVSGDSRTLRIEESSLAYDAVMREFIKEYNEYEALTTGP